MSNRLFGSICVTDLLEAAKKKHSAFKKGEKNGKLYANVTVWLNDEEDEFGNSASMQLSSSKEAREKDEKKATYIGNLKKPKDSRNPGEMQETTAEELTNLGDDLPF